VENERSEKPIKVGIIGVGQIGKIHLKTYQSIPGVEVVGVVGKDPVKTEKVAKDYNVPFWTINHRELLEIKDIDAVSICLHNNLHQPATEAALEAGKHVFCEKPMAGTYHDALIMVEAAKRTGKMLSIQLASLFSKETKAAQAIIEKGLLGQPYFACSAGFRRRGRPFVDGYGSPPFVQLDQAGGGALFDMGVYHIANVLYLLGNPIPIRISGKTYQEVPIDPDRYRDSGFNVEEFGAGLIHLEGDLTLNIIEAWAAHLDQLGGSYLLGSKGGLRLKPFGFFHSLEDLDFNSTIDLESFEYRLHNVRNSGIAYDGPQQHWIEALRGNVPLLPTAEIALNTMLISEGIYLSSKLGREVTADEVIKLSKSTANPF